MTEITLPPKRGLVHEEYDTTNRSFRRRWAWGFVGSTQSYRGGSKILVTLQVPARNDTRNWGGLYTQLFVSVNGAGWTSLGHSGYDGVMTYRAGSILTYNRSILYDPALSADFTARFALQHRSYNGTTHVNGSHGTSSQKFLTALRYEEILGD